MQWNRKRLRLGVVACALVLAALPAMAAFPAYVTFKGSTQGKFKGEHPRQGRFDEIKLVSLRQEAGPGLPLEKGAHPHKTIVITKEVGAASPQLFQAFQTNEVFPEVQLDFDVPHGEMKKGAADAAEKILLSKARIVGIRKVNGLEEITLGYEAITVSWVSGKTSTQDDWTTPATRHRDHVVRRAM